MCERFKHLILIRLGYKNYFLPWQHSTATTVHSFILVVPTEAVQEAVPLIVTHPNNLLCWGLCK